MKLILKTGLLAAMVFALVGISTAQAAIFSGPLPLSGCLAGKAKCVIKMKSCMLGCYNKSVGKGLAVDAACLDKCRTGFLADPATGKGCIEKLDTKNAACGASLGDAAVLRSKITAHVLDLSAQLNPAGTPPGGGNKCSAGKNKCVSKYNACVLGIVGKAFKAGTAVGDLSKCNALLQSSSSCVGKLETKYGSACLTEDDQGLLKASDDAFVNDIIYDLVNGQQNTNTKRCTGDTSVQCTTTAPDCTVAGGTCDFFFGAPLPLAAGGVATCVTNQWNGAITGTFNQQTGASAGTASVIAKVYTGGNSIDNPCPVCAGANEKPNDGIAGGTCTAGVHAGAACDSNGESPVPSFGKTSLDCPPSPGSLVGTLPVDLSNVNTGTVTATVSASSPNCNGSPGDKCLCASCSGNSSIPCKSDAECALAGAGTCTNAAGEPRKPNACIDGTTVPGDGTICDPLPGGEGECSEGPVVSHCKIETFRGCITNGDCTASGDECTSTNRECYPGYNGAVGDTITAQAAHDLPHNHTGTSTFASIFCVAPTGATAVNSAAGLPGPGRLQLGGVSSEDGTAGSCPTVATFLPTAKGGVLDTGWNGLGHDAKVVGQGMVTVGVTGCSGAAPNCGNCTYTGPVANP